MIWMSRCEAVFQLSLDQLALPPPRRMNHQLCLARLAMAHMVLHGGGLALSRTLVFSRADQSKHVVTFSRHLGPRTLVFFHAASPR